MRPVTSFIMAISRFMYWIAGMALVSIVLLTVTDVILRRFRMPIDWAFEVVVMLAAVVISFALPQSTLDKGHVLTDFLIEKLSPRLQKSIFAITRIMAIFVFVILGWRVICLGQKFCKAGQISPILELPDYPVAYAVAVACFIECLVLLWTLVERVREGEA
ncbi:MAG: TRAP-type C4-dicarboxylate transport system, small permease component [Deltaproteobacteria bacterium]|nr:TRAP-type C4-dicarboxylate transport system, small permease component [Deltaproteobacteria bacterium]